MQQGETIMAHPSLILALAGVLIGSSASAQSLPANLPGWMAGCWITKACATGRRSEECWTVARGAMMLGSGHLFDAGKSIRFEHMRIVREGGTIAFIAQPGGAPPTRFRLETQSATAVSFINETNDYPQRVIYRLVDGSLQAEIAMKDGSRVTRWRFKRA